MKLIFYSIFLVQLTFAQSIICLDPFSNPERIKKITSFRSKFKGSGGSYDYKGHGEARTLIEKRIEFSASGDYRNPLESVTLDITMSETKVPVSQWSKVKLKHKSDSFDLIETGERTQLQDQEILYKKVLNAYQPDKHEHVIIRYKDEKLKSMKESTRQQKIIHKKVIDTYSTRKGHYLKQEDLDDLTSVDAAFPDQTVFALMKPARKRVINQTDDELYDNVQATLSVVFSRRNTHAPVFSFLANESYPHYMPLYRRIHVMDPKSWTEAKRKAFKKSLEEFSQGNSPFPKEIEEQFQKHYKEQLKKLDEVVEDGFDYNSVNINTSEKLTETINSQFPQAQTFAEFTRFAKFEDISDEMFSKLILKGFEKTKEEGVDVILLSADRLTKRLFERRYKFKTLGEIETKYFNKFDKSEKIEKEFIMYMEVDSPEFKEVYKSLQESSSSIREQTIRY